MTGTSWSAQASSTMAAASGSWKTLNSAAAVALLISTPPPMKTIRPIRAKACGCTRASSARLVIGASGTTVTGAPAAACASMASRSRSIAGRGSGREGGRRHPEVGHAVGAVHVPGVDRLLEERARGPDADGDVAAAGGLEHHEGVAHDVGQRGVAADAGHRAQVEPWVQRGEEEGAGVVDAGVDVEDHGEARHGVDRADADCVGAPVESRQHAVRAERAACCLSSACWRGRGALGGSRAAHVPSTGAVPDASTPPDPPPGRHRSPRVG